MIKPCPFEKSHVNKDRLYKPYPMYEQLGTITCIQVYCPCGAKGPNASTEKEAIEKWNNR